MFFPKVLIFSGMRLQRLYVSFKLIHKKRGQILELDACVTANSQSSINKLTNLRLVGRKKY